MPPSNTKKKKSRNEPTRCRDCKDGIDYKDLDILQKLVTQQGKMFGRKRSGLCAGCQRQARIAVKRARYLALMPFVG